MPGAAARSPPRPGRRGGRRPRARRSWPAASRCSPVPTSRISRHMRSKESWNAAQCSRSARLADLLPHPRGAAAPRRRRTRPRSRPRGRAAPGSGTAAATCRAAGARSRCRAAPRSRRISRGSIMLRHAGLEHAAGARVEHHDARRADVAAEAPARALDLAVGVVGEVEPAASVRSTVALVLGARWNSSSSAERARARGCPSAGRAGRT